MEHEEHNRYLLSAKELAARLGVSVSSIYAWRRDRGFPSPIGIGALSRWKWPEVAKWLDEQPRVSVVRGVHPGRSHLPSSPGRPRGGM